MNKRSAIAVALGLVAALAAGGFALSMGLATTGTAAKAAPVHTHQKPKVRTIKRTITIHKKAKNASGGGTVVVSSNQSGSAGFSSGCTSGSSSYSGDDTSESDGSSGTPSSGGDGSSGGGDD